MRNKQQSSTLVPTLPRGNADDDSECGMGSHAGAWKPENGINYIRLKDCCDVVGGATPKRNVMENWGNDVPWVTPKDISKMASPILNDAPEYISKKGYGSCSTYLLPKGSILFTSRAPIGNVAIAGREMCTNQGFKSLVPKADVDSSYLYHCMKFMSPRVQNLGNGATFKEVSKKIVEEFKIPLPPIKEQKRIAAILDKADAIRRKRQQAIDLTDQLLRSVFLDMFGDPVTNPRGWVVKTLDELVSKLGDGLHGTPNYDANGDYYFINGNNLNNGKITISKNNKKVNQEEFEKHKKELTENTMLVSINGTIGKVAFYNNERIVLGKSACYFNLKPDSVSAEYLYHLIQSHYFLYYTSSIVTGSTIKNVSLKSMRNFPVLMPPRQNQNKFEKFKNKHDVLLANLKEGLKCAEDTFNSLTQQAFNGQLSKPTQTS